MQIHTATEIPSATQGHESVLDDLLENQVGKFLLTKERLPSLIIFPGWMEHYDMAQRKLRELDIPGFHGGGRVVLRALEPPFPAECVDMRFDAPSLIRHMGFERPHSEEMARKMIEEGRALIASVLTSVRERRDYNAAWEKRDLDRSA